MTATITETDIGTTVLDDLDFEPVCKADWNPKEPPCDHPAKWVVYFVSCCVESPPIVVCDSHKDDILTTNYPAVCKMCGEVVCSPFRKAIIRIEPLKGGAS